MAKILTYLCLAMLAMPGNILAMPQDLWEWEHSWENPTSQTQSKWRSGIPIPTIKNSKILWLRTSFGQSQIVDPIVFIEIAHQRMKVYQGDDLIYSWGYEPHQVDQKILGFPPHFIKLNPVTEPTELRFRFETKSHKIGVNDQPIIGNRADILVHMIRADLEITSVIFMMLILGILVLLLFLQHPRNPYFLSGAMFPFFLALYLLSKSSVRWLAYDDPQFWLLLDLFSLYIWPAAAISFVESVIGKGPFGFIRKAWVTNVCFTIVVAVLSCFDWSIAFTALPMFQTFMIPVLAWLIWLALVYCLKSTDRDTRLAQMALLIIASGGIHDIMVFMGILAYTYTVIHWASMICVICFIAILSNQYSRATSSLTVLRERSNFERQKKKEMEHAYHEIKSEKQKVEEILGNIKLGILIVEGNTIIQNEYSRYTEEMFSLSRSQLVGSDVTDILFTDSSLCGDQVCTMKSTITTSMGLDDLTWETNALSLVKSFKRMINGEERYFNAEWYPIFSASGILQKLMICVKDATSEMDLVLEVEEKDDAIRQQTEILKELLIAGRRKSRQTLRECHVLAKKIGEVWSDQKESQNVFRMCHTIKGSARVAGFSKIADLAHACESAVIEMPGGEKRIHHHFDVYLQQLLLCIDSHAVILDEISPGGADALAGEQDSFSQVAMKHLDAAQKHLKQHQIEVGQISTTDEIMNWKPEVIEKMGPILLHLLTNAAEHGFSLPKNHEVPACISVEAKRLGDDLIINIIDNGVGFDIEGAGRPGVLESSKSDQVSLEYYLHDGVTTAESVSKTSGRGVGLSAVKQLVEELGGRIVLANRNEGGAKVSVYLPVDSVESFQDLAAGI